jgi:hypothetical protein
MIKFGEKFAVTLIGSFTAALYGALFLLATYRLTLAIVCCGIFSLLYIVVSHANIRRLFWCLYAYTQIAFLALLTIVEWNSARVLTVCLGVASAVAITLWSRRVAAPLVFVREKPLRRAVTVCLTFAIFALCAFAHTLLISYPLFIPAWLVHGGFVFMAMIGTYLTWTLYYQSTWRDFFIPTTVVGVIMVESSWVAALGSAGYFVRAFGITVMWYVIQLFIRFHFGNRDIVWSRQRGFIAAIAILFLLYAFVIRFL